MSTDETHTPTTLSGRDLLVYTVEFLRENPERHNQGQWVTGVVQAAVTVGPTATLDTITSAVLAPDNECGTTGCVAGWGAIFAGFHQLRGYDYDEVVDETGRVMHMQYAAREAFGLDYAQAEHLFSDANEIEHITAMLDALIAVGPTADLEPFTPGYVPHISQYNAEEMYNEWLNEVTPDVDIDGWTWTAAEVFRTMNEDAYARAVDDHAEQAGFTID